MIYEVKSAIIFAAGRGSRMEDLSVTPKALLPVHGQPLIERMIEQMLDSGINEIVIATGYKHKMFDYLVDKYDVTLAYNKKWFCTNSITSFEVAFDALSTVAKKYAVITTCCDLYFTKNIFCTKISESGYIIEYSEDERRCMKEWTTSICGANRRRIINVYPSNSNKRGYILKGLAYWTPMDIAKIAHYTKMHLATGLHYQAYFDDVPCFLNFTSFDMTAYVCEEGSIIEVGDKTDYLEINKENENESAEQI